MPVYMAMTPAGAEDFDKVVFLRDGFSIGAFALGPVWLLWNRAYLAAGLWLAVMALVAVGANGAGHRAGGDGLNQSGAFARARLRGRAPLGLDARAAGLSPERARRMRQCAGGGGSVFSQQARRLSLLAGVR